MKGILFDQSQAVFILYRTETHVTILLRDFETDLLEVHKYELNGS